MPLPTHNEAIAELNLLAWTLVGATSGNLDVRQTLDQLAHAAGVREVGTMHVIYELNGVEVDESWAQARVDGTGRHGDQIEAAARADHIRDVPDRDHGIGSARSLRLKNSSQKKPSQYCDTALMRHTFRFGMSAPKRTLEPVSDTPTTCPVRFPLQPSCCLTACTDPYIRLASACLGTQRTGPIRYRGR